MRRIQYKSVITRKPLSTEELNEYVARGYTLHTAIPYSVPSYGIQYIFYTEILIPKK
jgi:hypothetical protein